MEASVSCVGAPSPVIFLLLKGMFWRIVVVPSLLIKLGASDESSLLFVILVTVNSVAASA